MLLAVAIAGCEDVVDVELESVEPKLVIEGVLRPEYQYFRISRTTDFYTPYDIVVPDADIIVADNVGHADTLWHTQSGIYDFYTVNMLPLVAGRTYYATVTLDGQTYEASTTMPYQIAIDSLTDVYQEGGGIGADEDEGYRLHVFFKDVANRPDYVRITINNDDYYYLYDGRYSDGHDVDYDYFLYTFSPNRPYVYVELWTMDRVMYDYFQTLSEVYVSEDLSDFTDATPANPNSNWSNGALGYFGSFVGSAASIYIGEE